MARIISISINEGDLETFANAERRLGFANRSELLREGVKHLVAEQRDLEGLNGRVSAVGIVAHGQGGEGEIAEIKHEFEDVISTQVHNNRHGTCLEVFVLEGSAVRVRAFTKALRQSRKVRYAKIVVE